MLDRIFREGLHIPDYFEGKNIVHLPTVKTHLVSEFSHDYVQWPVRFKRIAERWERTTTWGQLFTRYRSQGYIATG